MKYDLFLDSDLDDKPVADMVYAALAAGGLNCYYPRWFRLRSRGGYGQFVRDELDDSQMLMVIFSESAARPDSYGNVFLDHIDQALHHGKHVIALVLDGAMVPVMNDDDKPLVHLIDVTTDAIERELGMLVELARELVGRKVRSIEEEAFELQLEHGNPSSTAIIEGLIAEYRGFIRLKALSMIERYQSDIPIEELINEGLIGLIKAVRDYNSSRETGFRYFAELCITRQLITAIKVDQRSGR